MSKYRQFTPPVGPPVIQRVLLCDLYEREHARQKGVSSSLPGHLIQLHLQGQSVQTINGRQYDITPNTLIWFHDDERVEHESIKAPWRFYTLNFIAESLSPPPIEDRVRKVGKVVRDRFDELLKAWRDVEQPDHVREMNVQAKLLLLIAQLSKGTSAPYSTDPTAELWWELETELRRDLSKPITLERMRDLTGKSQATIARACQAAVGLAPIKRMKQVRMSMARGLVTRSNARISEIAHRIGYSRVHEFSRDYKKHFGQPPTEQRKLL